MERFAPVALRPGGVVLALTHQTPIPVLYAPRRVPVALASTSDLQVRHGVEVRVPGQFRVVLVLVSKCVQPAEDDFNVSSRYPVLQHRGVVKVVRRRSAVQRAESD